MVVSFYIVNDNLVFSELSPAFGVVTVVCCSCFDWCVLISHAVLIFQSLVTHDTEHLFLYQGSKSQPYACQAGT